LIQFDLASQRGTPLRKNKSQGLTIDIESNKLDSIFLINGKSFKTEGIANSDLKFTPNSYYMVINRGKKPLRLKFNQDISKHQIIYDPYKFEFSKKPNLEGKFFEENYNIPNNYIDTLPKWYSFKFTYSNYNLIFIKPEYGLSIQLHNYRNEFWEILEGRPIVIIKDEVHYFVENGSFFNNPRNTYHSIINPNKEHDKYVIIKERWEGNFDENDIRRDFNPNQSV
jgi:mannose-6-phosphate isomerase-like protein (cupin superfamily)